MERGVGDHEVEPLSLLMVEVDEGAAVHILVLPAPCNCPWQGLQVHEFGGHRVLLRRQEVAEEAWRVLHAGTPSVKDGLDEVLGRHNVVRWYKELDYVRSKLLLVQEELAVGHVLGVDIFHWNPWGSILLVYLPAPPERRGEVGFPPGDRQDVGDNVQLGVVLAGFHRDRVQCRVLEHPDVELGAVVQCAGPVQHLGHIEGGGLAPVVLVSEGMWGAVEAL